MKRSLFFCLFFLFFLFFPLLSSGEEPMSGTEKVKVGISLYPPYTMERDGGVVGFAIDLWQEVAKDSGLQYEFELVTFKEKLQGLNTGRFDVSIGGITVKSDREKIYDFGSPEDNAGLMMAVKKNVKKTSIFPIIFKKLFNREMLYLISGLFGFMLFLGLLIFWAEKGSDIIRDKFKDGYPDGVWCVWMIITTIGFGDVYPKKFLGRLLTVPIFFLGLLLVSLVSAPIFSAFTVRDIEVLESRINNPKDIMGKVVATKENTASVEIVRELGAYKVLEYPSLEKACEAVAHGLADVVVYDAAGIKFYERFEGKDSIVSVGGIFEPQYYAYAYPQGSKLRETIDRSLLKLKENKTYERIHQKWFGEN